MKKQNYIAFKAVLLLLIYLFSNSPMILFHHHDIKIVSYEQATPCEKSIYYAEHVGRCNHKAHISNEKEKCCLCDQHTLSPYFIQKHFNAFYCNEIKSEYQTIASIYFLQIPSSFANRGPPVVSTLIV